MEIPYWDSMGFHMEFPWCVNHVATSQARTVGFPTGPNLMWSLCRVLGIWINRVFDQIVVFHIVSDVTEELSQVGLNCYVLLTTVRRLYRKRSFKIPYRYRGFIILTWLAYGSYNLLSIDALRSASEARNLGAGHTGLYDYRIVQFVRKSADARPVSSLLYDPHIRLF